MTPIPPVRIVLLGATGSIGASTLEVIRAYPERFRLVGISGHQNAERLVSIANEFRVPYVGLTDSAACRSVGKNNLWGGAKLLEGPEALESLAELPEADLVVVATVGLHGLKATLRGIEAKKKIALANKEVLVVAGQWVMPLARKHGVPILTLDSEHVAISQCLKENDPEKVSELILTASGGPLRQFLKEDLFNVTPEAALKHPNWSMGQKITLDCATLANKGLEVIEAHWLFNQPYDKIRVIVHPESLIHSMVSFVDGSILAQISPPKMTFAIQYSLSYPDRLPAVSEPLNWNNLQKLTFEAPDTDRFPCLKLAYVAGRMGGAAPIVFNAVNEVAGEAFLRYKINFMQIAEWIEKALSQNWPQVNELSDAMSLDHEARRWFAEQL